MSLVNESSTRGHASMCRQFQYDLCWHPEQDLGPGTQIELRSHCLRAFLFWKYFRIEIDRGDVTFRWKVSPTVTELSQNRERVLMRATLHYGARKGEQIHIRLWAIPSIEAGVDQVLSIWTIASERLAHLYGREAPVAAKEDGSECRLDANAGPVELFYAYARPAPGRDCKVRVVLSPEDRFGNPGRFETPVTARLTWNGRSWDEEIAESKIVLLNPPAEIGRLEVSIPMDGLSPNENVMNGQRRDGRLVISGNPVWAKSPDGRRPAFGEFHWHTEFSPDGQRPIEEAARSARDLLNMDWIAPSDHSTSGDAWQRTVEAMEEFNADHEFVTFFGWENSTYAGHDNYYFVDPQHSLVCGGSAGFRGGEPRQIVPTLSSHDGFLAVAHHTNATAETRDPESDLPVWGTYLWPEPAGYLRLVEMMQIRGNQERNDYTDAWRGWHQHNGCSVQDALAAGHKLGFTGGTDDHCGWPGRAYAECEHKGIHPFKSVVLTGVWTDNITRQSVYDALYARRTWAVWDTRAIVYFTVNGVLSGGEVDVGEGTDLTAHVKLSAEDALQSIEIISEGKTVWVGSSSDLDVEIDIDLGRASRSTNFYLRALQRNGGIIYASPVFVNVGGQ